MGMAGSRFAQSALDFIQRALPVGCWQGRSARAATQQTAKSIIRWSFDGAYAATAGVPPRVMGIGRVPATQRPLQRTTLSFADFEVNELKEASQHSHWRCYVNSALQKMCLC
jgi:Thiolase, C-terminal domain